MNKNFEFSNVLGNVSFRHLQLPPRYVSTLEGLSLFCPQDILACPPSLLTGNNLLISMVNSRLSLLSKHIHDAHIEWSNFWNEDEIQLFWLAMDFREGAFDNNIRSKPLKSLDRDFGTLLRIPQMRGIETLGEVIALFEEGIYPWPGYGAYKIEKLGSKLFALSEKSLTLTEVTSIKMLDDLNMPESILSWNISALGIGPKLLPLKRKGYETLGSIFNDEAALRQTRAVGFKTIRTINSRIEMIGRAIVDGTLDLDKLAEVQQTEIYPPDSEMEKDKISEVLSDLIKSVAKVDPSPHAEIIANYRICTAGSESATLDEIAKMKSEKITRERVRQIENRILKQVLNLLTKPYPTIGLVLIRPVLKTMFIELSKALSEQEEISPADLGLMISQIWECGVTEAFLVLPLVIAIMEGAARNTSDLKRLGDSPNEFFIEIKGVIGKWPVQNLATERSLSLKLSQLDIHTLENLRIAWISGQGFGQHEGFVKSVLSVACSGPSDEAEFLEVLSCSINKPIIPKAPSDWVGYIETVQHDVADIICLGTFWSDSKLIFVERTSILPNERSTMDALGKKIGRLGVTVKRTETETLTRLASAVLYYQGGYVQCLLRPDWLELMHELKRIFDRFPTDQEMFRRSIEEVFEVNEQSLTMAMPTIWAILSGLPTRKSYGKAKVGIKSTKPLLAPVKLSGFRSVH